MAGVFINARFLTQPMSGVQRYAFEVLTALDRSLSPKCSAPIIAFYPANGSRFEHPPWKHIEVQPLPGGRGHFWEQGALWRACRKGILLSLCNSGPILHKNQIVALHDANIYAIPQAFSRQYRMFHKALRPVLARHARQIVTVSAFSAQELSRYCRMDPDKFRIIPNSANHILDNPADIDSLIKFGLPHKKYLLAVGNQSPNKNIGRLVAACTEAVDLETLVIVGGESAGLTSAKVVSENGVQVLGRVDDRVLRTLYEGASGFVWPSLYEGFGIPPLEAMALGTPVLASRSSAMPEVLGDAPLYFDPNDSADIYRALKQFCSMTEAQRDEMRTKGLERARQFTWEQSAASIGELLNLHSAGAKAHTAE